MKTNKLQSEKFSLEKATFYDYISIARFDHCIKHVFILPGVILACLLRGMDQFEIKNIALGILTAMSIASANYVINEWLDRESDRFHPIKSKRASVQKNLSAMWVLIEWIFFIFIGISSAYLSSELMLYTAIVFALQGVIYNVRPFRSKDSAYVDVISESINNPIRLIIGWAMIAPTSLPPASLLLAYWLGGAFLMAAKRLSEYKEIVASHGKKLLIQYRISFSSYTDISLTISCFIYAMLSNFFLAIFLIKYRIEYILMIPVITILFGQYLAMAMKADSSTQNPEKLYREKSLIYLITLLICVFIFSSLIKIPALLFLIGQNYIQWK